MPSRSDKPEMTAQEILSTLKHSSLPTVLIEGSDDVIVFRKLENIHVELGLSILPTGGRETLLEIFRRSSELNNSVAVAFICDRDAWVLDGIPSEYVDDKLIFTSGYSIENDIYVDGDLEQLLTPQEKSKFDAELEEFLAWYALAFYRYVSGNDESIKLHPNAVLDDKIKKQELMQLRDNESYPIAIRDLLKEHYMSLLRGKSLMNLLVRHISYPGRTVKHNHKALMEMVAAKRGPLVGAIFESVAQIVRKNTDQ